MKKRIGFLFVILLLCCATLAATACGRGPDRTEKQAAEPLLSTSPESPTHEPE